MMRKINYIYYIVMLALWPAVDRLLSIGTRISPLFFWLLPLYAGWFPVPAVLAQAEAAPSNVLSCQPGM